MGQSNFHVHSQKDRRYRCAACHKTFAETKGTLVYHLRSADETVTMVITLLAHDCPPHTIVAAFDVDERTVHARQQRAGQHGQQVQEHLVQQPHDLDQVQADELRVKLQDGRVWMTMAIQVSSRLWLGGVVSAQRNLSLLVTRTQTVRACALPRPVLICTDGRLRPRYLPGISRSTAAPQPPRTPSLEAVAGGVHRPKGGYGTYQ